MQDPSTVRPPAGRAGPAGPSASAASAASAAMVSPGHGNWICPSCNLMNSPATNATDRCERCGTYKYSTAEELN
jgi:hypothetical protein